MIGTIRDIKQIAGIFAEVYALQGMPFSMDKTKGTLFFIDISMHINQLNAFSTQQSQCLLFAGRLKERSRINLHWKLNNDLAAYSTSLMKLETNEDLKNLKELATESKK